ncbi:MAG: phage holin, LLH family, partial [Enterococcus sp.]
RVINMEAVQSAFVNFVMVAIVAGLGWLGKAVTAYFKREGLLAELENKKAYVAIVVSAMQQVYAEADGPGKLQKAKVQIIDYFQRHKIQFTEAELDNLIEDAVKAMKEGIKEGASKPAVDPDDQENNVR